ncbi:MAG: hypothetical protein ACJAVZ_005099 [Afipia broomeae]|jgi:hypothetical protein
MTVTIDRFRTNSGGQIDEGTQDRIIDAVSDLANLKDMLAITAPLRALF